MEDWQKEQIKSNLSSLVNNTSVNVLFLAELQQEDVLSDIEVEQIMARDTSYDQAKLLYEIIVTKANSYYTLIKALTETQQSGATKYLFHPSEGIRNLKVNFQEKTQQLGNLLNHNQIQAIHTWLLNSNFSESERKALTKILNEQKEIKLLRDTIPKPYPLYIPRFVSVAQFVDPNLFRKSCLDTFVFKNVERSYLSNFVETYDIKPSTTQLLQKKITSRFILLDSVNDWEKICAKIPESPVHLLKYDEETDAFIVKATSGGSEVLRENLKCKHANPECILEEDFVDQIITENVKGVCICDSPGMGKSDLLASIARRMEEKCPKSITSFIQLRDFEISENLSDHKYRILNHISTSKLATEILHQLTKDGAIKFTLFFDGLDEVNETNLENMAKLLRKVSENMTEARLFVTSRPCARAELEKSLGLIAYDILPFNEETQRNYLTAYWIQENSNSDELKLNEFAEFCVQSFGKALKTNIKTVSGIPLQCQLIAKVYSDDAAIYADKDRKTAINLPENIANSLSEVYSKFMLRQLGPSKCRYACMHNLVPSDNSQCDVACKVKSFHVWQALRLIDIVFVENIMLKKYVAEFDDLRPNQILGPGILKLGKSEETYEFSHRTFAEFLVAEYIAQVLFTKPRDWKRNQTYDKIADEFSFDRLLVNYSVVRYEALTKFSYVRFSSFKEDILPYFLNASLTNCLCAGDTVCVGVLSPVYNSYLFVRVASCLHADYQSVLKVLLQGIRNFVQPSGSWVHKVVRVLKREEKLEVDAYSVLNVIQVAAQYSDVKTINQIFQYFQDELHFDFTKLTKYETDPYMVLPIQVAVKRGDFYVVEYLANKFNLQNMDLLYWCVQDTYYENEEIVETRLKIAQLLLSKQADLLTESVNISGTRKNVPVILSPNIHLKAIQFLVRAGVNVKSVDKWYTNVYINALDYMSDEDFVNLRNFLFVECNAQDWFLEIYKKHFCPFGFYLIENKVKTVLRFLDMMVKEAIIIHKSQNAYLTLLESDFYRGLFFHAVASGIVEIVDYFLKHAPTFLEQRLSGEHSNELLTHLQEMDYSKIIDCELLGNEIGKPLEHYENVTPILLAARFGQTEMVRFLVNRRANIFAVDAKGRTILHLSAIFGKSEPFEEIVRMAGEMWYTSLPTYHRDANSQREPTSVHELFNWHDSEEQNTPLHKAVQYINWFPKCFGLFLSCGQTDRRFAMSNLEPSSIPGEKNDETFTVNVNAVNTHGHTGLHIALFCMQEIELVEHLIKMGADWKMRDNQGCNVAHICARMKLGTHLNYFLSLGGAQFANQLDKPGNNALQCALVKWNQNRTQEHFCFPSRLMYDKDNKRDIIEKLKRMGCEAKTELAFLNMNDV